MVIDCHSVLIWERIRPSNGLKTINQPGYEFCQFLSLFIDQLEIVLKLHRHITHFFSFRTNPGGLINGPQNMFDSTIYAFLNQVFVYFVFAKLLSPLKKCHTMLLKAPLHKFLKHHISNFSFNSIHFLYKFIHILGSFFLGKFRQF